MKKKVFVALSGGVDSSVAAYLLLKEGFEVTGITMNVFPISKETETSSLQIVKDVRQVAHHLAIPYHVMNFREIFMTEVISYFCQEYREARTPNPCVLCNQRIKFKALWEEARFLGADYLATGHYARIVQEEGRFLLKRGLDKKKDQSYILYRLTQEQLRRSLMPLGEYSKEKVISMAEEIGLPLTGKKESQEICFIPDNDYRLFLKTRDPSLVREGPILDQEGRRVGTHEGLSFYTIGQRKGLGISNPKPTYVVDLLPEKNALVVGDDNHVYGLGLIAHKVNWVALQENPKEMKVKAQIRYQTRAQEATVQDIGNGMVRVLFLERQRAITKGQSVVFYEGDLLLGGGIIQERIL